MIALSLVHAAKITAPGSHGRVSRDALRVHADIGVGDTRKERSTHADHTVAIQ
jgi:hypothetical protein